MGTVPELPEVAALALFLRERTVGRVVTGVDVAEISALKTFSPAPAELVGRRVTDVCRHGKWIDVVTAGAQDGEPIHLVVHLARAGWLRWHERVPDTPVRLTRSPLALRVRFDDGSGFSLTEAGTRRRLAVHVVTDPRQVPAIATLGVEPLSDAFTVERLGELLAARRQQVKGLLRDQGTIAGIGNAYSDEILHAARMSPFKPAGHLTDDELQTLYDALRTTLGAAVDRSRGLAASELNGEKKSNLAVHNQTGKPCPVCGDIVREVSFADSSLQYCPTCQTGGKPLADRRMSKLLK